MGGRSYRTLIEFAIRRHTSEDQEIHWLETASGKRGYVASGNGPRNFEMEDNDHDLRNDFNGCDCFGCVRRKRNSGYDRRQPARRAYAEVRSYLLSLFD